MPARNSVDLLWGNYERPTRGPKPGLSLDRIVRAAMDIADEEGLDAVSMQRISNALGSGTMSLYRYVPGKDQLLDLMLDAACGQPPEGGGDWRSALEHWMHGAWRMYQRHPWVLRIPFTEPTIGPNRMAWLESVLGALSGSGLANSELVPLALFLDGAVRELARMTVELEEVQRRSGLSADEVDSGYLKMLREHADPQRHPTLDRLLAEGVFHPGEGAPADLAPEASFGLNRLLDGIESYVRSRSD